MKKLLIVTYYWPPSGGAAVQRWLSFANKLAENGFDVHLLTVDPEQATFQLYDESLLKQVHPAIRVHTTLTREPFKAFTTLFGKKSMPKPAFSNEGAPSFKKKVARFIRGNFFIPDPRKGWRPFAVKKAAQIIQEEAIRWVITAGPPHSTHFIGMDLKRMFKLFWVADFHDLWTDVIYYDMLYHLPFVKRKDARLERSVLEGADMVITVGEKYKQKLLSKSGKLSPEKIEVLRIGYDEKFFGETTVERQDAFTVTYTGTLATFYRPEVFIAALATVVQKFGDVRFRLCFAGVLPGEVKAKIVEAGLGEMLEDLGYVAHAEAIRLMRSTTVLLLVNPVTKDEGMVIPGKVYEYLAAQKPVINITVPSAETATLLAECDAGQTFSRNRQSELEKHLSTLVIEWRRRRNLDLKRNEDCVAAYSRAAIAKRLMTLLSGRV